MYSQADLNYLQNRCFVSSKDGDDDDDDDDDSCLIIFNVLDISAEWKK